MVVSAEGLTDEQVVNSIESALAEQLGVHPQNVAVTYDKETGIVTFTISSDEAESLTGVQAAMGAEGFSSGLSLAQGLAVTEFTAPSEVVVTLDFSVDASNVDNVDEAVTAVEKLLEENSYTYESKGKSFCKQLFRELCS